MFFPNPQSIEATNHAIIRSFLKEYSSLDLYNDVPAPCCVPDKLSPLSVLYVDQHKNVVLKVYPNMSVDSCSCR